MNKKAEQKLIMNKLVVLILIILVILAVVIGIWKFGMIDKIKDLFPDFNRTGSNGGNGNTDNNFNFCPVPVADIKDNYIYIGGTKTNLILYKDRIELEIGLKWSNAWNLGNDKQIGTIENYAINIDDSFFDSKIYDKYPELPSLEKLNLINGSYKPSGYNYLCKEK